MDDIRLQMEGLEQEAVDDPEERDRVYCFQCDEEFLVEHVTDREAWACPACEHHNLNLHLHFIILGLLFGVGLGPFTFAYMAPLLGVTFKLAGRSLAYGVLLLAVYGVGHCSVIVLAGTCTELVQRYLNWTEKSRGAAVLRGVCGVLVILGGLYLIYITP